MKDTYYFIIKLRQKLIRYIIENEAMFDESNENVGILQMVEIINNLDEMELLEFYLAITEVDEREILIVLDSIKNAKADNLPF